MVTSHHVVTGNTSPHLPLRLDCCPLASAASVLDGKWTLPLLWWLGRAPKHFGELRRQLPGVSPKVLSATLTVLTNAQVVSKTDGYDGRIRRVEYTLTESGRDLVPILDELCHWGVKWSAALRLNQRRVDPPTSAHLR